MKSYELKTYSITRHNLIVFVGIAVAMLCFGWTIAEKLSLTVCMTTFFAILGGAKLIALKSYCAVATFSVTDNGFTVSWTKEFAFWREPDYDLRFDELKEYVIEPWGEDY